MSRSTKKGPYVLPSLYKKVEAMNEAGKKSVVKTWSRSSTLFPEFVGDGEAGGDGSHQRDEGFRVDDRQLAAETH